MGLAYGSEVQSTGVMLGSMVGSMAVQADAVRERELRVVPLDWQATEVTQCHTGQASGTSEPIPSNTLPTARSHFLIVPLR